MATLTIDEKRYSGALSYAKRHKTSITQMVDRFLTSYDDKAEDAFSKLPVELQRIRGLASNLKGYRDPEDERFNYLMDKYGL